MSLVTVPPKSLEKALAHLRAGGELYVPTYTHCYTITKKSLEAFEAAGMWLIKEEGEGYRMKVGRSGKSVYVMPGQLKAGGEINWATITQQQAKNLRGAAEKAHKKAGEKFEAGEITEAEFLATLIVAENLQVFILTGERP